MANPLYISLTSYATGEPCFLSMALAIAFRRAPKEEYTTIEFPLIAYPHGEPLVEEVVETPAVILAKVKEARYDD